MNALFWNIGKLTDYSAIGEICRLETIDILMTAEDKDGKTIASLNSISSCFKKVMSVSSRGLNFYTLKHYSVSHIEDQLYFSAKSIQHARIGQILFILVHYPSKLHMDPSDQMNFATQQYAKFSALEKRVGTQNTIIVGDFNFNPHEDAMLSANGMNAVCCSLVASKKSRKLKDEKYEFFYNPMWKFYTKMNGQGNGTYYGIPKGYKSVYWNIFDQAIYRPHLISEVNVNLIESYTKPNSTKQDTLSIADHRPIKIRIKK